MNIARANSLQKKNLPSLWSLRALLVLLASTFCISLEAAKGGGKPGGSASAPEITSISPTSGSSDGGTLVTINGKHFARGASVTFGGIDASGENVRNGKRMTAISPAVASGLVDVTVTNPDGLSGTLVAAFTYEGQPLPEPLPPTALNASAVSAGQINLSWLDNSSDETGFSLERSPDGIAFTPIASLGPDIQFYADSGLQAATQYFYRVRAFNGAGNSAYSNTADASTDAPASVVAFPGAEGFGRYSPGGRGGQLLEVTNLNDDGPGSFRAAVETPGARIVVFRTGGTIELQSPVQVFEPFITIAAQTAPGDGIALKGEGLFIHTHDIIVRGLRIRIGDLGGQTCCRDGINISTSGAQSDIYNVIIDHASVAWAIDENIATWESSSNSFDIYDVTIQWTISAEALHDSIHVDEGNTSPAPHSMGLLLGRDSENISTHHNLLAHNNSRNPRLDGIVAGEVINNLIFDWGQDAPTRNAQSPGVIHVLNNFYHSGANSRQDEIYIDDNTEAGSGFYIAGNLTDDARVSAEPFPSRILNRNNYPIEVVPQFSVSGISMDPAEAVFARVLGNVGAIAPLRDGVDARIVSQVSNRSGSIIDSQTEVGGWPSYDPGTPLQDSDHDGMPDNWEVEQGLDPLDASDGNGIAISGYTQVEEYINSLIPLP